MHRLIKTASEPDELDPKPVPRRRRDVTQSLSSMSEMRLPSSPKRTFSVGDTCLSCDKKPNVKFSPCGHTNMCSDCAVALKRCIECRVGFVVCVRPIILRRFRRASLSQKRRLRRK